MSDVWGDGLETASAELVFDLERAAPDVFEALAATAPRIQPVCARLRAGVPLMGSSVPGVQGDMYRLKWHNRSVCLALGPDKTTSDVVVVKGSEPLLPDFPLYLDWMQTRQFGTWPRPIMEHFPLFEGKAPGTLMLSEATAEAETALDVQRKHLRHYGQLFRLPVPLFVFSLPAPQKERIVAELRRRMSQPGFERVEAQMERGLGMFVYYYPAPPIRVHAAGRRAAAIPGLPAHDGRVSMADIANVMVPGWTTIAARLLWLGYFPSTPLSWRLGDIFEPNNACLDGGACDVGSIYPMERATNDGFFARSVAFGVGSLRTVLARVLGLPLGEMAANLDQDLIAFYLGDFVRRTMEAAMDAAARDSLTLDPRVRPLFSGDKSLPDLMSLFRTLDGYLSTADYTGRPW